MIEYLIGPLLTLACAALMVSYWVWRIDRRRRAWVAAFETDLTAWREQRTRESAAWHAEQDRKAAEWRAEWDRKAAEYARVVTEADAEYARVVTEIERDIGRFDAESGFVPANGTTAGPPGEAGGNGVAGVGAGKAETPGGELP